MAAEYYFESETNLPLPDFLSELRSVVAEDSITVDEANANRFLFRLHGSPCALFRPDAQSIQVFQKSIGMRPKIVFSTRLNSFDRRFDIDQLVEVVIRLCERVADKAVLTYQSETPILMLEQGTVTLNTNWAKWDVAAIPTKLLLRTAALRII